MISYDLAMIYHAFSVNGVLHMNTVKLLPNALPIGGPFEDAASGRTVGFGKTPGFDMRPLR